MALQKDITLSGEGFLKVDNNVTNLGKQNINISKAYIKIENLSGDK